MASNAATKQIAPSKDALLKSYRKRLKDDIDSMVTNFSEIVKLCRLEEENQITRATQCEQDAFEMQVRAANMVRNSTFVWSCTVSVQCYGWFEVIF